MTFQIVRAITLRLKGQIEYIVVKYTQGVAHDYVDEFIDCHGIGDGGDCTTYNGSGRGDGSYLKIARGCGIGYIDGTGNSSSGYLTA